MTRRQASAASSARWAGRRASCTKPWSALGVDDDGDVGQPRRSATSAGGCTGSRAAEIASTGQAPGPASGVERLGLAGAPPLLGHADHPVERRPPGRSGRSPAALSAYMPPMQKPRTRDRARMPVASAAGDEVADLAVVVERADRRQALLERQVLAAGERLGRARPPSRSRRPGARHMVVEQRPQPHDVGAQRPAPWPGRRRGGPARPACRRAGRCACRGLAPCRRAGRTVGDQL